MTMNEAELCRVGDLGTRGVSGVVSSRGGDYRPWTISGDDIDRAMNVLRRTMESGSSSERVSAARELIKANDSNLKHDIERWKREQMERGLPTEIFGIEGALDARIAAIRSRIVGEGCGPVGGPGFPGAIVGPDAGVGGKIEWDGGGASVGESGGEAV